MSTPPSAKKRAAMDRLRDRARRINLIRRSVVTGAVVTFALAWGLALNDQLASGTSTRSSSDRTSSATRTSDDVASTESESSGLVVPATPTVAPTPAPAPAPTPVPLTTSQS